MDLWCIFSFLKIIHFPFISVHQNHQVELLCKNRSSGHVTKSVILIGCLQYFAQCTEK